MSKDTILVVTASDEISVPGVLEHLKKIGQQYLRLNTDMFLKDQVKILFTLTDSSVDGAVYLRENKHLPLDSIKSVWFRKPKPISTSKLHEKVEEVLFVEKEISSALWSFYTTLDKVFWMNHPLFARYALENNKLLQLKLASLSGLVIPDTMITNNPTELVNFCQKHGGSLALKTLAFHTFENEDGTVSGIYTNRVSENYIRDRLESIAVAPLMAQEYVEKELELRVTIVGQQVFSCAIHSQNSQRTKDDWRRYDFENVKHEQYKLPSEVESRLLNFMKSCRLHFGAVDMILTPRGEHVFLEVNPSGQFGWIESLTGMPISRAIAETLSNPNEQLTISSIRDINSRRYGFYLFLTIFKKLSIGKIWAESPGQGLGATFYMELPVA